MGLTYRGIRKSNCLPVTVLVLLAGLAVAASAQELARPGLDTPKIRVAVAEFKAIGTDAAQAADLSDRLRRALSAHPQVQMIAGAETQSALAEAADAVLSQEQGACRSLGDKLGVDAVIYGTLIADVNGLLDDPLAMETPLAQIVVAETLTLHGELYPSPAIPVKAGADATRDLESAAVRLLPALGRVLSIIESPEGVEIQLFPMGGRVLATDTEYGVYDPVVFRTASEDGTDASTSLAMQELRTGALAGRVRSASASDDHAIGAQSTDPRGRVSVGQLVGLPPLAGSDAEAAALPTLLVSSSPMNAVVTVNGKLAGVTPVAVGLQAGQDATVTVSRRDFKPISKQVTPAEGEGLAMAVALGEIPPFGTLKIATTPAGAAVLLDGEKIGETPLDAKNIKSGTHQLKLERDGYKPVVHTATVRRQRTTELNFTLGRDLRAISIASAPDGARITLDGVASGTTPLKLDEVQTGTHELKLSLNGHAMLTENIEVAPVDTEQIFSFRLRKLAGNLRIETTPPGVTVSVDGREQGKTPLALTALAIGPHKVDLNADGFLPVTKTVAVQDQQTTTVQETMTKAAGQILCISVPAGARISLDGRDVGVTPLTLTGVPVGRRALTLTAEGYQPWTANVPVVHEETTKVEVGLIRTGPGLSRTP